MSTILSYSESNQSNFEVLTWYGSGCGQAFTAPRDCLITSCKFYLKKNGSPASKLTAKIYAASGTVGIDAVPTGSSLGESGSIAASSLSESFALVEFTFTTPIELVSGQKYAVVVEASPGGSLGNNVIFGIDDASPSHDGNEVVSSSGPSWVANSSYDSCFYILEEITSVSPAALTVEVAVQTPTYYQRSRISSSSYSIELRDKNGNFKDFLHLYADSVSWEWNRIGGCGACSIVFRKGYRDISFSARDDIQIRVESGTTSKLVYRGYIANVTPVLNDDQKITLQVRGYFDLLKKIVVHNNGTTKTYTSTEVSLIVDDIIDTFVVANSPITKGVIDASDFTADSLDCFDSVENILSTLADLAGGVEYGVDENLVFFWRTESEVIRHKFFVGVDVEMLERAVKWDDLVNKVYLIGGDVAGGKYKKTGENTDSQNSYYLSEQIIQNGSIKTDTVADQFITAKLRANASPKLKIRAKVANTSTRFEDTVPLGLITFYDPLYDKLSAGDLVGDIVGEAADGGSDIIVGEASDGGSDKVIGGQYASQVDRIQYAPSDTPGRFNVTLQFGDTVLETAARLKRLELALSSLQQY